VTYWLPGDYDPNDLSKKAICPLKEHPKWFVIGESYSMRQGWIEGGLEHANLALNKILTVG
jgi:hypothetical protein